MDGGREGWLQLWANDNKVVPFPCTELDVLRPHEWNSIERPVAVAVAVGLSTKYGPFNLSTHHSQPTCFVGVFILDTHFPVDHALPRPPSLSRRHCALFCRITAASTRGGEVPRYTQRVT